MLFPWLDAVLLIVFISRHFELRFISECVCQSHYVSFVWIEVVLRIVCDLVTIYSFLWWLNIYREHIQRLTLLIATFVRCDLVSQFFRWRNMFSKRYWSMQLQIKLQFFEVPTEQLYAARRVINHGGRIKKSNTWQHFYPCNRNFLFNRYQS